MKLRRFALYFLVIGLVGGLLPAGGSRAQNGNQWRIDYYANTNWSGAPVYTQYANLVDRDPKGFPRQVLQEHELAKG